MSPAQHLRSSRAHVPDMAQTSNSPAAPLTPQQPSSTKSAKASKGQTRDNTEQQDPFKEAVPGSKRKVRFSLSAEEGEEDAPAAFAKKPKKYEGGSAKASDDSIKKASKEVVKEWTESFCKDVLGSTMKNPWDMNSDDESELESDRDGPAGEGVTASEGEGGATAEPGVEKVLSAKSTDANADTAADEYFEGGAESHRLPQSADGATVKPTAAGWMVNEVSTQESTDTIRLQKLSTPGPEDSCNVKITQDQQAGPSPTSISRRHAGPMSGSPGITEGKE